MNSEEKPASIALLSHPDLKKLIKYAQIMPSEMMKEIQKIAQEKAISVELEIASRLLVSFIGPVALGGESLLRKILNHRFSQKDAFAECKRGRQYWRYPYEIKKLELFLEFKGKLPRQFKEQFTVIDVKSEVKRILEKARNRKDKNKK